MALRRFMDRSTLIFCTVATLSCSTLLISTAIVTHLATTLTGSPDFSLAVTASIFEIFALSTVVAAVSLFLRRESQRLLMVVWFPGTASCFIGSLLSMVSLGLAINVKENVARDSAQGDVHDLALAGLTVAVLGLVPQTAFFVLIWPRKRQARGSSAVETPSICPSPVHSEKRSIAVHLAALSPARAHFFKPSESCATPTSDECSRYATCQGRLPMSSKTRLLLGVSFASQDSCSIHSRADFTEPARTNSDFENWDTSAVEAFEQPFAQKTLLEPIPGSRPASPANPLDGPFGLEASGPQEPALPESPLRSPTASLSNFRRPSEHEEFYYHPLFRSESPAPPLASPGTVITASPFAGQIVSSELVAPRILHSAASSRPASPSILSPARSHAGSVRSFRTLPTSPIDRVGALSPLDSEHRGPAHLPP